MQPDREDNLLKIEHLLNTPVGVEMMDDLRDAWDQFQLIGKTPEETAYNVGLRDAFKFLKELQSGTLINK